MEGLDMNVALLSFQSRFLIEILIASIDIFLKRSMRENVGTKFSQLSNS